MQGRFLCLLVTLSALLVLAVAAPSAYAQPGTKLTEITVPVLSPSGTGIGIAADCSNPVTLFYTNSFEAMLRKMDKDGNPVGVDLPITDSATGVPVSIGAIQWDETRKMLWGGTDSSGDPVSVYLIDPATGVATFKFQAATPWIGFTDGITFDASTDTVYVSDDVSPYIDEHDANAPHTLLRTLVPTDAGGNQLGTISGVLVGKGDLLYVGRNGLATVDTVKKSDGSFLGSFAAAGFRVEDLECDLNSFPGKEALWVKDAYNNLAAAFEVEAGTCQCGGGLLAVAIDIKFCSDPNGYNCRKKGVLPVTIFGNSVDVSQIDVSSLQLCLAGNPTQCTTTPPKTWSIADRGDPTSDIGAAQCAIVDGVEQHYLNPDGKNDLDAGFLSQEVASLIGCAGLNKGDASATLILKGTLLDGTPFQSVPVGDVGVDQLLIQQN